MRRRFDTDPGLSNGSGTSQGVAQQRGQRREEHRWEEGKMREKDFFDDGTMTYFWRRHTITVLLVFSCLLFYVSVIEDSDKHDGHFNTKRGIFAVVMAFLCLGVTQQPDGPFMRPHPALWRLVMCIGIVYELFLIFVLFQSASQARRLLKHIDDKLGVPLPEKDYGGNCYLYDPEGNPDSPFHNIWDKLDVFVPAHFFGWWAKTLIIREYWLATVISVMFELLEYTLEHQLPNFSECWWDHWILDALVCNGLGIWCGMLTVKYLSFKPYHWHGMWSIPTYTGKLRRLAAQFTPYTWMDFDWRPTLNFKRWLLILLTLFFFLLAELNSFYLKFVLWIPPPHYLNLFRVTYLAFAGAVAIREMYQYADDPDCDSLGRQSWLIAAIIITELLIILKFDWQTVTLPLPRHVTVFWLVALATLVVWTIYEFYVKRYLYHIEESKKISMGMQLERASSEEDENTTAGKVVIPPRRSARPKVTTSS